MKVLRTITFIVGLSVIYAAAGNGFNSVDTILQKGGNYNSAYIYQKSNNDLVLYNSARIEQSGNANNDTIIQINTSLRTQIAIIKTPGDSNKGYIEQLKITDAYAKIYQPGKKNVATIKQGEYGTANIGIITQFGSYNNATIKQIGTYQEAIIDQPGNHSIKATITQIGNDIAYASIKQYKSKNSAEIKQTNSKDVKAYIDQDGDLNVALIKQEKGEHLEADQTQKGFSNNAKINQDCIKISNSYAEQSQFGDFNSAEILQTEGDHLTATQLQCGSKNIAYSYQTGLFNCSKQVQNNLAKNSYIEQSGSHNCAVSIQE
ncbi:MAG: hypothetical protein JW795_19850 [Chitinivibrionales bacterium]|nr:hypothetical protein [Chitinivibrionales bacterium]